MRLISQIRPNRPDFTFLTGWEAVLVPMLMIGCDGGTHASSNVVPEVTRRIYDLYRSGDTAAAMKWQFRLLELFDAMLYPFEFPFGFKAAAELRGIHFGTGRLPQTDAQRAEHKNLTNILQCILADFELVNPPAQGCPVPAGATTAGAPSKLRLGGSADPAIGPEHVQELVNEVLHEMKNRGLL
jgi:4-hydroxy-tetrahydrodipicolinate synthase